MNKLTTYKGFVDNGSFEKWSGGLPVGYEFSTANTQVVQLRKEQQSLHLGGIYQFEVDETRQLDPNIPLSANPLVREGHSALRFRGDSGLAAGDFEIRTRGIGTGHGGAVTGQLLPIEGTRDGRFSFWARGTPGKLYAVNLIMRVSGTPFYFTGDHTRQGPLSWPGTADALTFEATANWQQHQIDFQPLEFSGGFFEDGFVWSITNVSTGPFILDLDDIEYEVLDPVVNERPV